ncbi:hypothetical protein ScPMuIL_003314 [Solemya velum]
MVSYSTFLELARSILGIDIQEGRARSDNSDPVLNNNDSVLEKKAEKSDNLTETVGVLQNPSSEVNKDIVPAPAVHTGNADKKDQPYDKKSKAMPESNKATFDDHNYSISQTRSITRSRSRSKERIESPENSNIRVVELWIGLRGYRTREV